MPAGLVSRCTTLYICQIELQLRRLERDFKSAKWNASSYEIPLHESLSLPLAAYICTHLWLRCWEEEIGWLKYVRFRMVLESYKRKLESSPLDGPSRKLAANLNIVIEGILPSASSFGSSQSLYFATFPLRTKLFQVVPSTVNQCQIVHNLSVHASVVGGNNMPY